MPSEQNAGPEQLPLHSDPSSNHTAASPENPKQKEALKGMLRRLDESDLAPQLKRILEGWLEQNLSGAPAAAYSDTIKERKSGISIGQMLEIAADAYLAQNPSVADLYKDKKVSATQFAEQLLDFILQSALAQSSDDVDRRDLRVLTDRVKRLAANAE